MGVASLGQAASDVVIVTVCRALTWARTGTRAIWPVEHCARDEEPPVQPAEPFAKHRAEYVPKLRIFQDHGPAQGRFTLRLTRRLLCLLSYTGWGLAAW